MIVVINPSNSGGGHSFKGLHAYCAHDEGEGDSSERVEWTTTRNVPSEDPEDGWRLMIATSEAQTELKQSAGMRAGRASKHGPVMHVVLSFAAGEPTDRAAMEAAADGLLGMLGAKTKSREQYAAEHQVVMYAHNDTGNRHLHLMINRVHPIHGANLPTSNDRLRAQKWALAYSKQHGTADQTPERQENAERRAKGEYVKGQRRKSRNVHEIEQLRGQVANDNPELEKEAAADATQRTRLAQRRRALAKTQAAAQDRLAAAHTARVEAIEKRCDQAINKARHETREAFRDRHRALAMFQQAERATFASLEETFFGRLGNAVRVARLSEAELGHRYSSLISRSFQILTSATRRRQHFEAAQERSRKALERQEAGALSERVKAARAAQAASLAQNRATYAKERDQLEKRHETQRAKLKARWRDHGADQAAVLKKLRSASSEAQNAPPAEERRRSALRARFGDAAEPPTAGERQSDKDRGGQKMN